ncbi:MAG: hypothetical protein KAR20_20540, partial [Candidatus Heimdallarchaeota archaeon]|nr:hypothetical protein [Candidatus Heimdallarchaeota archaeon]
GVSPRAVPKTKGILVRANGDEHDELGFTLDTAQNAQLMTEKRLRKLQTFEADIKKLEIPTTKFYGPKTGLATIISWGSPKGAIRKAMQILKKEQLLINYLQIRYILPFPKEQVQQIFSTAPMTILVENTATAQLSSVLRENVMQDVDHKILKYDGRPFLPQQLADTIKEVIEK